MAPPIVVMLEPGRKRAPRSALEVKTWRPLTLQGAVEAFDLAVLPRTMRTDERLPGAGLG